MNSWLIVRWKFKEIASSCTLFFPVIIKHSFQCSHVEESRQRRRIQTLTVNDYLLIYKAKRFLIVSWRLLILIFHVNHISPPVSNSPVLLDELIESVALEYRQLRIKRIEGMMFSTDMRFYSLDFVGLRDLAKPNSV